MKYIIFIGSVFLLMSCSNNPRKKYEATNTVSVEKNYADGLDHPGKKLMENNCYVCHNPTASEADRIGPPMIAIKKHYISENTTKEEFVDQLLDWVKEPTEEKSKMPGAVRRFNLMPYQQFPEETIRQIADYMYDHEIEQPEWFEEHFQNGHGKGMRNGKGRGNGKGNGQGRWKTKQQATSGAAKSYKERGLDYALSTKAALGKNLMGTIQKEGTLAALEFCNVNAYPLTDSMATYHNARIKRVSDKPRNSKNKANVIELQHIATFKKQLLDGNVIEPIISQQGSAIEFYYPIVTNTMCLQCHGDKQKDLNPLTLHKTIELYPNDKALDYKENEVRGIWSISFND